MPYQIIFSDIDGTLLNHQRELSEHTKNTIKELNHLPFVLISARMPAAMRHLQKDLDIEHQPIICYNGGLILVDNEPVSSTEIPVDLMHRLSEFNSGIDCHLSLYHNDEWYVPQKDRWADREENNTKVTPEVMSNADVIKKWRNEGKGAHKIMAMGSEEQIDQIRDFLTKEFPNELHLYRSKPTYLEIAHKRISKFTAISHLLENHFNLKPEESVAFGDNYNDVEMIKGVGMGVAVANARKEVLEVANLVTGHGKEDGVAAGLKKLFKTSED
ncbi:HAD family hydrolase [Salegentibacter chungangensis]|uniref:HAD family hydrolase n=1 Tax=Salegentibacter chungangensis TaxID=1335724 RepID=A0ABW3NR72_9FLAO